MVEKINVKLCKFTLMWYRVEKVDALGCTPSIENVSFWCTWMRIKIIEFELHYICNVTMSVQSHIYCHYLYDAHGITRNVILSYVSICVQMNRHYFYDIWGVYIMIQIISSSIFYFTSSIQNVLFLVIIHHVLKSLP